MPTKNKPASKSTKAAKPSESQDSTVNEVEIRLYPHVAHVHLFGDEMPSLRAMIEAGFDADSFAAQIEKRFKTTPAVNRYDALGNRTK